MDFLKHHHLASHRTNVSNKYAEMLQKSLFCDVKFLVEGQEVSAHKVILCCSSDYFRSLLCNGMLESFTSEPIRISDKLRPFLAVLNFIYSPENAKIAAEEAIEVLDLAFKYRIAALQSLCLTVIQTSLCDESCIPALIISAQYYQIEKLPQCELLYQSCLDYLIRRINQVIAVSREAIFILSQQPQKVFFDVLDRVWSHLSNENLNFFLQVVLEWTRQEQGLKITTVPELFAANEQYRCEWVRSSSFLWKVPEFSHLSNCVRTSPDFQVFGDFSFCCRWYPNDREPGKCGIYVGLAHDSRERNIPVVTLCHFVIVNSAFPQRSVSSALQSCVQIGSANKDEVWGWGVPSIIDLSTLTDPAQGFLLGNVLKVEVILGIDSIQSLCLRWFAANFGSLSANNKGLTGLCFSEMSALLQLDRIAAKHEGEILLAVAKWMEALNPSTEKQDSLMRLVRLEHVPVACIAQAARQSAHLRQNLVFRKKLKEIFAYPSQLVTIREPRKFFVLEDTNASNTIGNRGASGFPQLIDWLANGAICVPKKKPMMALSPASLVNEEEEDEDPDPEDPDAEEEEDITMVSSGTLLKALFQDQHYQHHLHPSQQQQQ